eukprot:COSAG05_NODE_345_length_10977_cov_17.229178_12_plen_151_part_00
MAHLPPAPRLAGARSRWIPPLSQWRHPRSHRNVPPTHRCEGSIWPSGHTGPWICVNQYICVFSVILHTPSLYDDIKAQQFEERYGCVENEKRLGDHWSATLVANVTDQCVGLCRADIYVDPYNKYWHNWDNGWMVICCQCYTWQVYNTGK